MSEIESENVCEFVNGKVDEVDNDWEELKVDNDYLICKTFPYQIKRKSNGYIIKEWELTNKYIQIKLNGKLYLKHIVIARQWIENDDPEHKTEVDHRNRIRSDYHVSNLRYVSKSENMKNKTGHGKNKFEYVDELPIDVVPIILYMKWEFEGYYIDREGFVWFDNGEQYRKLNISKEMKIRMYDINNCCHNIGIRGIRREFL